jgi:hypothetical protein
MCRTAFMPPSPDNRNDYALRFTCRHAHGKVWTDPPLPEIAPPRPLESLWVRHAGDQCRGQCWTDPRNLIEPFARFVGPVPGDNPAIEL